jgi:hypothetical protein
MVSSATQSHPGVTIILAQIGIAIRLKIWLKIALIIRAGPRMLAASLLHGNQSI